MHIPITAANTIEQQMIEDLVSQEKALPAPAPTDEDTTHQSLNQTIILNCQRRTHHMMPGQGHNKEQWWDYCLTKYHINEVAKQTNILWNQSIPLPEDRWKDTGHLSPEDQQGDEWQQWHQEAWESDHRSNAEARWQTGSASWRSTGESTERRGAITASADRRGLRD